MPKIKELLVEVLLPAIKLVGKTEMKAVLSGIQAHNSAESYQLILQSLHSNFSLLKQAAYKTKTKVDDGIIDLVLEAVKESADAGSVSLS